MSGGPALLPWSDRLLRYDFGAGHPLGPVRVELTMALARSLGVLDAFAVVDADPATDDDLLLVHDEGYLDAVRRAGRTGLADPAHGLGTPDNPVFASMHEASALVAGATLRAAQAVVAGEALHAVNVAGGLHHAMRAAASGFCVYNDPAVAIAWMLAHGVERVAYVDIDVHHGDGVEAAFWDDPRVLTVSLHESGRSLWPGTGFAADTGGPQAPGTAVNVALPAGTGDDGWLSAFDAVVPPLVQAFAPQVLVTQHGCDTHALDPLAHLMLSVDGQRLAHERLHRLAHDVCGGQWLAVGGGGYELVRVVPRTWTHLLALAGDTALDPSTATPEDWRELVTRRTGGVPPTQLTDGRAPAPAAWTGEVLGRLDEEVAATRAAVFPSYGLLP